MKNEHEIKEQLRQWVLKKNNKITDADLTLETGLLEKRIISSLHIMELILEVERIKGSKFNLKNIKPGSFNNINSIYSSFFVGDS
jgi:acyl carrier protein